MSNKLVTLLEAAGRDINIGIRIILPYALAGSSVAALFFPGIGPIISVAFTVIISAENKFKDVPKSGSQKLAWAMIVLGPIIKEFVPDGALAEKLVSGLADLLNKYDEKGQVING